MSHDSESSPPNLPFNLHDHTKTIQSAFTTVYLPDSESGVVVKANKFPKPYIDPDQPLRDAQIYRLKERIAMQVASPATQEAIVPQSYVVAQGSNQGTARTVRIQPYVERIQLRKLGLSGILGLPIEDIRTLKGILQDSMKCFLTHGTNFDLFGSDERDAIKSHALLELTTIKKAFFPLRNSSNLLYTNKGIKLIDPNVLGIPDSKMTLKSLLWQGLLFASSVADYAILTAKEISLNIGSF